MTTVKPLTAVAEITLCFLLSFSLELTTGAHIFKPPRFVPERLRPLEVDTGSSILLVCESEHPVIWHYPGSVYYIPEDDLGKKDIDVYFTDDGYFVPDGDENSNENTEPEEPDDAEPEIDEEDEITIVNITQSFVNGKYRSVFHMPEAKYLNTGYYYCILNHTRSLSVEHNLTRQYIFVKDEQHMIATKDTFPVIHAVQYQKAVIPCRPSSPDFNITLKRLNEVVNPGKQADFLNVTYSIFEGFILQPVDIHHSGFWECQAMNVQTVTVHLQVLQHTDHVYKPTLKYKHPVMVGDTLHIECTARAESGVKFTTKFRVPKAVQGVKQTKPCSYRTPGYECDTITFTVENVTLKDAGNYSCLAIDQLDNWNAISKVINIYGAKDHSIKLTLDGDNPTIVKYGTPNVVWVVKVNAIPLASFQWYNHQNETIPAASSKYMVNTTEARTQTVLTVNHIDVRDSGTYSLHAFNNYTEQWMRIVLEVTDTPTVSFEETDINAYYELNKNYTINCKVVGHPKPEVEWSFMKCNLLDECEDNEFKNIQNPRPFTQLGGVYVSSLEFQVTTPGILRCFARNSEGSSFEHLSIFVTDMPHRNSMGIWGKPDVVVEGDDVTLYCGATIYNYTNHISWSMFRPGRERWSEVETYEGVTVSNSNTTYSYRSTLLLKNVKFKSDANYSCGAQRKEDGMNEEEQVEIVVKRPVAPYITQTNLNETERTVSASNILKMECFGFGLPKPTIKWYKDGKRIILARNVTRMRFQDDNQTFIINIPNAEEDEGTYTCEISNRINSVSKHMKLKFKDKPKLEMGLIVAIGIFAVALVIIIFILAVKVRNERKLRKELDIAGLAKFEKGAVESINPELPLDDQAELLPYDKKWEFPREKLKLGKQLGAGAFGVVMKAEAIGIVEGEYKTTVAVKMVKRTADHTYIKALASELKIMIHLGKHLNVVNLLGACTKNLAKMELLVIVEYCRFGNLHNYLLRHREDFIDQIDPKTGEIDLSIGMDMLSRTESTKTKGRVKYATLSFSGGSGGARNSGAGSCAGSYSSELAMDYRGSAPSDHSPGPVGTDMNLISMTPTGEHEEFTLSNNSSQPEWRSNYRGDYKEGTRLITTRDIVCWAFQIARGMEYLASRKVLHGDLAARNILLADDNVVKICDFGLAKSMYKCDNYRKKGDGPLPIKWMAIESIRDRIFSTQSDVWSFGIVLWELFTLAKTPYPGMAADEKLYNKLVDGYRMEKPQYASKNIYNIMLKCWRSRAVQRPTFSQLSEMLGIMLEDSMRRHYIDLNDPYMHMNAQWFEGLNSDYLSMMSAPTYDNMVSPTSEDEHEYVNSPASPGVMGAVQLPAEDSSGYLCMKSPPAAKNNPSCSNVFSFSPHQVQKRLRGSPRLEEKTPEHKPMLCGSRNNSDSDIDQEQIDGLELKNLDTTADINKAESNKGIPSGFSNPNYAAPIPIIPSADNYVNMPQQKSMLTKKSDSENRQAIDTESYTNPNYVINLNSSASPKQEKSKHEPQYHNSTPMSNYQNTTVSSDAYVNIPSHDHKASELHSDGGDSIFVN